MGNMIQRMAGAALPAVPAPPAISAPPGPNNPEVHQVCSKFQAENKNTMYTIHVIAHSLMLTETFSRISEFCSTACCVRAGVRPIIPFTSTQAGVFFSCEEPTFLRQKGRRKKAQERGTP